MTQDVTVSTPWLQRTPSATAAARVFAIPHAGCGTGVFAAWPQERSGVEYLPVELPGRLPRFGERPPPTLGELATDLVTGLAPFLDRPFAFFGHCWSALLAYEATARLQQRADLPDATALYVSSQVAPQDGPVSRMLAMDDTELAADLAATIRDLGNDPHPELIAIYTAVLRADVELSRHYTVPHPTRLTCPLTAIGWSDDTEVAPDRMTGWSACGDTTFTVLPGRHQRFADGPEELFPILAAPLS
jgi:surfactin synthase thioesterase subunit